MNDSTTPTHASPGTPSGTPSSTAQGTAPGRSPGRSAARAGLVATGVAVVANLVVWGVARLLGADLEVQGPDGATTVVGVVPVLVSTLVPMLLATGLLAALAGRWRAARPTLAWVGLVVGVVTAPAAVFSGAGAATAITLGLMHVVAGAAWWTTVRR